VKDNNDKRGVSMLGTARHYFARGNTARGAHFLYASAFQQLTKVYLLDGPPGTGKSTILQQLTDVMIKQGRNLQLFHSPLYPDSLDAIIISDLKVGVADGRLCEGLSSLKDVDIVHIDFGQAVDESQLSDVKLAEIHKLQQLLHHSYSNAYSSFATALRTHDDWEKVYINHMNFAEADHITQHLISSLFEQQLLNKQPTVRHLFFGAATPIGAVDHIQNLTADLDTRIFIKGRPGSGKSTLLKQVAKTAEQQGYDLEIFHCGFDPHSLDMLIIPELSLAIFDSTAPHQYFPNRIGDEILDMYERTIQPGTDEHYATELEPIKKRYSQHMKVAISYLAEAQKHDSTIKAYYVAATDFKSIQSLYDQLRTEIELLTVHS
jgi:Cdc6-like AAA superfamily ATPase